MSKTTIFLLIILLLFFGLFLFILYGKQQNPVISSFTKPLVNQLITPRTSLSFSETQLSIKPAQTITVAVVIHNPIPAPNVVQLEIGYDPTVVMVDEVNPGSFFIKPYLALDDVDTVAGRISFALRCQKSQISNSTGCINSNSSTVATITLSINPYTLQNMTSLSFFPKTVIRTTAGRDLLDKKNGLKLIIDRTLYPVSSSSGLLKPEINTPIH